MGVSWRLSRPGDARPDPGEPDSCSTLDAAPPASGRLYVLNVESGRAAGVRGRGDGRRRGSVTRRSVFSSGLSDLLSARAASTLRTWRRHRAKYRAGTRRSTSPRRGARRGRRCTTRRMMRAGRATGSAGQPAGLADEYSFPRYGFAAEWSPDGQVAPPGQWAVPLRPDRGA